MLIGVRQKGQPRPWLCTSLAHDSQKRWWPHGTSAMRISRGATRHTSQKSTAASADTVVGVPASSLLVSSSLWCCVLSFGASVSSSSSASEWPSLSIFSEPTASLTARRNCSRLSRNAFLGASDGQTAGNCWNMTHYRCLLACELRLATSRHESHDSHILSGTLEYFLLMAFHTLSLLHFHSCIFHPCDMLPHFPLLHFPLPHFQRPLRNMLTVCWGCCQNQ